MQKRSKRNFLLFKDITGLTVTSTEPNGDAVVIENSTTHGMESYQLQVQPDQRTIRLSSGDKAGMFYAVQSLRSILDTYNSMNIPAITIQDGPRFPFRGMHLDVARNFHTVEDVKRLITAMAMYKMNRLHLHLSDDEGWRLEIPGLQELTQVRDQ